MTAVMLSKNLPSDIQITVLETANSDAADIFYGTVTNPNSYNFHLNLGLTEADLLLRTQSSFSYGTDYKNWGLTKASWIQCFQGPLPSWNGIAFAHHISHGAQSLEHYLISAQAATKGKFAHPPADKNSALASAEYGYHFNARDLTKLYKIIARKNGVNTISQEIALVENQKGKITGLKLNNGERLYADLYVDAAGPQAQLISTLEESDAKAHRSLGALYSEQNSDHLGAPLRRVTSHGFGWQSVTPLQGVDAIMTVFHPQSEQAARKVHPSSPTIQCEVSLGARRSQAWSGNCVALGHAAAIVEPTTPGSIMLLQMDIERFMGLIPVTDEFDIEAKIYNDAFQTDVENIQLFNNAFFQLDGLSETPYWDIAKTTATSEKLDRKLKQFLHRGLLVHYDLEPFNDEDWTILHHGIGRQPQKNDVFAALSNVEKIGPQLKNKAKSIQDIVVKMPPHHTYVANYLNYLERKYVSEL